MYRSAGASGIFIRTLPFPNALIVRIFVPRTLSFPPRTSALSYNYLLPSTRQQFSAQKHRTILLLIIAELLPNCNQTPKPPRTERNYRAVLFKYNQISQWSKLQKRISKCSNYRAKCGARGKSGRQLKGA